MPSRKKRPKVTIGWREWVSLPGLGVEAIKPKIDTGARSSSIHALGIKRFDRDGAEWVRFQIHPLQRNSRVTVTAESPVLEYREVKSSTGHAAMRPVVVTTVELGEDRWQIELTLADRDQMGFRMLLGRQAVRNRYLVDSGQSYLLSRQIEKSQKQARPQSKRSRS